MQPDPQTQLYQKLRAASKCGNCRSFMVRPPEVELAQIALPMAMCGPGLYCHGGPVRGTCDRHQQMTESTQVCADHMPGGPSIRMSTPAPRGSANVEKPGVAEKTLWQMGSTGGLKVAFGVLAVLAAGTLIRDTHRWRSSEIEGLPFYEDNQGRRFHYKRERGGRQVSIFLPIGRRVDHAITPAATSDARQLEAEVAALVQDLYTTT